MPSRGGRYHDAASRGERIAPRSSGAPPRPPSPIPEAENEKSSSVSSSASASCEESSSGPSSSSSCSLSDSVTRRSSSRLLSQSVAGASVRRLPTKSPEDCSLLDDCYPPPPAEAFREAMPLPPSVGARRLNTSTDNSVSTGSCKQM